MTKSEFAMLLSRAFSIYLFVCAFSDGSYLPEYLFSLFHYLQQQSVMTRADYWTHYYLFRVLFMTMRVVAYLMLSSLFWRGGPRIAQLFLGRTRESPVADESLES